VLAVEARRLGVAEEPEVLVLEPDLLGDDAPGIGVPVVGDLDSLAAEVADRVAPLAAGLVGQPAGREGLGLSRLDQVR